MFAQYKCNKKSNSITESENSELRINTSSGEEKLESGVTLVEDEKNANELEKMSASENKRKSTRMPIITEIQINCFEFVKITKVSGYLGQILKRIRGW